jgi:uracil phosphoribosyltransferase
MNFTFHKLAYKIILKNTFFLSVGFFSFFYLNNKNSILSFFPYLISNKKAFALRNDPNFKNNQETKREFFEKKDTQALLTKYPGLHILNLKTVELLIGQIRDKNTSMEDFRNISKRLIRLILEETFAYECTEEVIKESPLGLYKTFSNPNKFSDYIAISILRSGNSMTDEILGLAPGISIGTVMIQRDENTEQKLPIFFFEKLPNQLENKKILVLDPMLATGGSASATINILIRRGVKPTDIVFVNIISCEEGIDNLFKQFPGIRLVTALVDPYLLPNKYIAPGIGDFGDRYYGTMD